MQVDEPKLHTTLPPKLLNSSGPEFRVDTCQFEFASNLKRSYYLCYDRLHIVIPHKWRTAISLISPHGIKVNKMVDIKDKHYAKH